MSAEQRDEEHAEKASLKDKLSDRMHKEPSPAAKKAAEREELALDTLVELLKSEDESIRLHAAQIILDRPKPTSPPPPGSAVLKKVKKAIL